MKMNLTLKTVIFYEIIGRDKDHKLEQTEENDKSDRKEEDKKAYNLRPSRKRDYSYHFTMVSIKTGLEKWGDKAKNALFDELNLFKKEKVFEQVVSPSMEQMKSAFRVHCFMTKKRDGRIKARAVADGRSQVWYLEEQTYSPTVRLESIMLCSLIDALEGRDVIIIDIKGAFLKEHVPKELDLIMKMDGDLARIFCELNPSFVGQGEGTLYLRCLKAFYGHIEAARLFYNELDYSLTRRMNYLRNKYDPCIYNRKNEDGTTTTIKTHVDNLKVSSKPSEQLQKVVKELKDIYQEITVHEGGTHDYLGMIMTYDKVRKCIKINMEKYIDGILSGFHDDEPDEKIKPVSTPATNNLFKPERLNNCRNEGLEFFIQLWRNYFSSPNMQGLLYY
jgi:hypothetical protein